MDIVIVTGNRPHCVYLCKELSKKYNVKAVFHYRGDHEVTLSKNEKERKYNQLVNIYSEEVIESHYKAFYDFDHSSLKTEHGYEEADVQFKDSMDYGLISSNNIFNVSDINSLDTIDNIKQFEPDVVVCHGGPKYSSEFIHAFKIVLNYHSGISLLYNGSDSHMFAFANGHPHLCGGTLMVMNEKIDGGDVLGHYLPKIEKDDWPGRLFIKGILGCAKIYDSFLSHFSENYNYTTVRQCANPLFYYRRSQWGLEKLRQLELNLKNDIANEYVREERIESYWNEETQDKARDKFESTINSLVLCNKSYD